jgi:hypothetical protein
MYIRASEELGEPIDETAAASWAASKRAATESYAEYKRDCTGVQLLSRLTRDKLDPFYEGIRLRKKVERLPMLFEELRVLKEKLKIDAQDQILRKKIEEEISRKSLQAPRPGAAGEWLQDKYRKNVAKLLHDAGFPPGYVLGSLNDELARARCELSQHLWKQYSLCNAMEEQNPKRFSVAVAEHYAKTELALSSSSQPTACKAGSAFCDVKFSSGAIIRVSLKQIPSYVVARQVAPKLGPRREYEYWCFKGNVNLSLRKP